MKKRFWVTLLALVLVTLFMVSCVQNGPAVPAAPDAATFEATPEIGVVELNWGAVPGATFYNIVINLVQPAGERAEQTQWTDTVTAPPYVFTVTTAGTYTWTVAAGNDTGTSDPVAGPNFVGTPVAPEPEPEPDLELELSDYEVLDCDEVTATITSHNEDVDAVQLWGKKAGENWTVLFPNDVTLDARGWIPVDPVTKQVVLTLDKTNPGIGEWTLRAQGIGNEAKSDEKDLTITEVTLKGLLNLQVGTFEDVEDGDTVCALTNAGATYTVDIDFMDFEDIFSEVSWMLTVSGSDTTEATGTSTVVDWEATSVNVSFATECTKKATLTVMGTKCSDASYYSTTTTLDFTLDMATPSVSVSSIDYSADTNVATMTVVATDTKGLGEASLTFFVEKGVLKDGWEAVTINWGTEEFTIAEGDDREITGTVEYSVADLAGAKNANATVVFDLGNPMDNATLTATVTFADFCDFGAGHVDSDATSLQYDNDFYAIEEANVDFIEGFTNWMITTDSTDKTGEATFCFMDANWSYPDNYATVTKTFGTFKTGSQSSVTVNATITQSSTDVLRPCTGWATKTTYCGTLTIEASDNVEGSVDITFAATDASDNTDTKTITVDIDTQPPQLAAVAGHMAQGAGSSDDYVDFALRNEDKTQAVVFEGATVTVNGQADFAQWYPMYADGVVPGSERGIQVLEESYQYRIFFDDLSVGLTSPGTVTVSIAATDTHGNYGLSNVTGNVSNPSSER